MTAAVEERAAAEAAAAAAERAADAADLTMLKHQLRRAEAERLKAVQVLASNTQGWAGACFKYSRLCRCLL